MEKEMIQVEHQGKIYNVFVSGNSPSDKAINNYAKQIKIIIHNHNQEVA